MKNKFLILTVMLGICGLTAMSQSLSPTVVSSSGGFYSNGSGMLSFTVAEMTMVQTFTSSGNFLTQGFQQPEDLANGVIETPVASGNVLISPNPTTGSFTISFVSYNNIETSLKLYNMLGQIIMSKPVSQITGQNTVNFDISTLSQGIYMLELTTANSKSEKITSFHKINLEY